MLKTSQRVAQRYAKKSQGLETREALRNIAVLLNNLKFKFDPDLIGPGFYDDGKKNLQDAIDSVTKHLFKVHVPDIKKYIVDEVVNSLKEAAKSVDAGKAKFDKGKPSKNEAADARHAVYYAQDRLAVAVQMLAQNPDNDEQKEMLARDLSSLVPMDNKDAHLYERSIKLCEELSKSEKGKSKEFFTELKKGLEAAYEGSKELRSAAAFAYKMLPKVR
jgi:hypothetical protein